MPILFVNIKTPITIINIPLITEINFKYLPKFLILDDKLSIAKAVRINGTARPKE